VKGPTRTDTGLARALLFPVLLALALTACSLPIGSSYGNSNGKTSQPGPSAGPPYTVTYMNTTVNTTGLPPSDGTQYAAGATVTVLGNSGKLSWPPFVFVGWNTQDNGGLLCAGGDLHHKLQRHPLRDLAMILPPRLSE